MNIAERMRQVLPKLRKFNDVELPDIKPECKDDWSEGYAIVQDVYIDHGFDESEYFDADRFWSEYQAMVKGLFPGMTVQFHMRSQEIEVYLPRERSER